MPATPGSPTFATSVASAGARPHPALERRSHRGSVGEHVGMVPFRARDDRHVRMVGIEVAGVLVRLDHEVASLRRSEPLKERRRRRLPAAARRRMRSGRGRRPPDVDQPSGGRALAVGAGDTDQTFARPPRRRPPAAMPRPGSRRPRSLQLGACGSIAVSALVTASRSGCGAP